MVSGGLQPSRAGCPSRATGKEDPRTPALPANFPAQPTPPSQPSRQTPRQRGWAVRAPLLRRFLLDPTAQSAPAWEVAWEVAWAVAWAGRGRRELVEPLLRGRAAEAQTFPYVVTLRAEGLGGARGGMGGGAWGRRTWVIMAIPT